MIRERFSRMSKFRRRTCAILMAVAVAGTSFDVASIATEASSSKEGRVITAFEELPEDIAHQYVPIGAKQNDIEFPDKLNVMLYTESETDEEPTEEKPTEEKVIEEEVTEEKPTEEKVIEEEVTEEETSEEKDPEEETSDEKPTEEEEPVVDNSDDSDVPPADDTKDADDTEDANDPADDSSESTDSGDGADDSDNQENNEGGDDADEGITGKAVLDTVKQAFIPMKAYAAEPDDAEDK